MSDRGIIFSAPMVRALLDGRKTQTRRFLRPQPYDFVTDGKRYWNASGVPGGRICISDRDLLNLHHKPKPGDRLYVREAHRLTDCPCTEACRLPGNVYYEAGDNDDLRYFNNKLQPSIHMPRWASRLTLIVEAVKVERVQDISDDDAVAEGIFEVRSRAGDGMRHFGTTPSDSVWPTAARAYRALWNSLHTKPGERWDDNPWVVATSFRVIRGNIDAAQSRAEDPLLGNG